MTKDSNYVYYQNKSHSRKGYIYFRENHNTQSIQRLTKSGTWTSVFHLYNRQYLQNKNEISGERIAEIKLESKMAKHLN